MSRDEVGRRLGSGHRECEADDTQERKTDPEEPAPNPEKGYQCEGECDHGKPERPLRPPWSAHDHIVAIRLVNKAHLVSVILPRAEESRDHFVPRLLNLEGFRGTQHWAKPMSWSREAPPRVRRRPRNWSSPRAGTAPSSSLWACPAFAWTSIAGTPAAAVSVS